MEEKKVIDYRSQKLHIKISTFLKFMVFRIISQIKKDPTQVEATDENQFAGEASISRTGGRRRPVTSMNGAGNTLFSFEIPEDIANMIDMDKLPHLELATNLSERTLSFKDRLEGWNIERRQRETGRCDVYYRHKRSKRVLRSIYEIVTFLMYESCPTSRKRKSCSKKMEEEQNGDEEKIWGNDNEDSVELYKKLEDKAAEALISLCDDNNNNIIANNNDQDKPPRTVDVASSCSSSSSPVANDDDDAVGLINHIPVCKSMEELEEFLINNRKIMHA